MNVEVKNEAEVKMNVEVKNEAEVKMNVLKLKWRLKLKWS